MCGWVGGWVGVCCMAVWAMALEPVYKKLTFLACVLFGCAF